MRRSKSGRKSSKWSKVNWTHDAVLQTKTEDLIKKLNLEWLSYGRIYFYRSTGSKARAYARTWGLPRLWQMALDVQPAYIVEIISEYFDKLSERKQIEVILHELSHIPKNFSGSLTPHTRSGHNNFHEKLQTLISKLDSLSI